MSAPEPLWRPSAGSSFAGLCSFGDTAPGSPTPPSGVTVPSFVCLSGVTARAPGNRPRAALRSVFVVGLWWAFLAPRHVQFVCVCVCTGPLALSVFVLSLASGLASPAARPL